MHVVLVAADQGFQAAIASMLETRGHEVKAFARSRDALDRLDGDQDVNAFIVIDAADAETGVEICWEARLRSSFERPVYVCLVAPPLSSEDFIEALDSGADDVLQLPISANVLYARLRAAERLNQMQRKLLEMATRDGLTGLYNRPAFFSRAAMLCAEHDAPLAGLMVDIDHFKAINDTHGHAAGDEAIRAVAECLKSRGDVVGRLGGEEFAVLLDISEPAEAARAADDLRRRIAMQDIRLDRATVRLSCSFGIAMSHKGETIDDLLRKADAALYAAKRSGRNKVALYDPETMAAPRPNSVIRAKTSSPRPRRAVG